MTPLPDPWPWNEILFYVFAIIAYLAPIAVLVAVFLGYRRIVRELAALRQEVARLEGQQRGREE